MSIPEAIAKTAQDAIHAKASCIMSAFYKPIPQGPQPDVYKELMMQMHGEPIKRQSPLVHAGYAIRMAALTSILSRFIQIFSEKDISPDSVLNVLILGAGLDPLGLWALSLHPKVHVYELDGPENVDKKADKLFPKSDRFYSYMFHKERHAYSAHYRNHLSQKYSGDASNQSTYFSNPNYHLMAADLRNISDVDLAIRSSGLQSNHPTLILSELVLAYLGKDYVPNLMRYINDSFCRRNTNTLLISYEPVHPTGSSVITGYAKDYFDQFTSKLIRGNHTKHKSSPKSLSSYFEPIGTSSEDVRRILRQTGFDGYVECSPIASISSYLDVCSIECAQLEPFDEHAALLLHLHCYSLLCATSSDMEARDILQICPWMDPFHSGKGRNFHTQYFLPITDEDDDDEKNPFPTVPQMKMHARYLLSAIQSKHQKEFQILFQKTYEPLFESFPSVKKLVQSALKSDLSIRSTTISNEGYTDCCIWNHYSSHDGAFFVILDCKKNNNHTADDHSRQQHHPDDNFEPPESLDSAKVIGGIGLKKCMSSPPINLNLINSQCNRQDFDTTSCSTSYYEIFRLAVDSKYQGRGIGKRLIQATESYIRSREWKVMMKDEDQKVKRPILLMATTPEILSTANHLYTSMGFTLHSEKLMGQMNIRTFVKFLHHGEEIFTM